MMFFLSRGNPFFKNNCVTTNEERMYHYDTKRKGPAIGEAFKSRWTRSTCDLISFKLSTAQVRC